MLKLLGLYNKNIDEVVLRNAPQNAKYISSANSKNMLSILQKSFKVQDSLWYWR